MNRVVGIVVAFIAALLPMAAYAQEELPDATESPPRAVSSSFLDGVLLQSDEALWMTVIAFVGTILTTFIVRQGMADDLKAGIYLVVSLLLAAGYTLTTDTFSGMDWGRRALFIFVIGTVIYRLLQGPLQMLTSRSDAALNRTP